MLYYENGIELFSLEYDSDVSLMSMYRRLIKENESLLTDEQKEFLYHIDKKYIKLYKKVKKHKDNISVLYLQIIVERALKFAEKYERMKKVQEDFEKLLKKVPSIQPLEGDERDE